MEEAAEHVSVRYSSDAGTDRAFPFEEIFRELPAAVLLLSPQPGSGSLDCSFANNAAKRLFAADGISVEGMGFSEIFPAQETGFLNRLAAHGEGSLSLSLSSGSLRTFRCTATKNGNTISLLIGEEELSGEADRPGDLFRDFYDASPNLLYIFDISEQRMIYGNSRFGEYLGYTPEQIQDMGGESLRILIHPDDLARAYAHLQKFFSAGDNDILSIEYRIRNAQGGWRWLSAREKVYRRDRHGLPVQIIGSSEDITGRKRELEELGQQRLFLLESQEIASIGSFVWDMRNDEEHYATPEMQRIFGALPDEKMDYGYFTSILHPDDRETVENAIREAVETRKVYSAEYRLIHRDGTLLHVKSDGRIIYDAEGVPLRMVGTVMDISEKKRAEEIQRRNENFIQKITEISPGLITVFSTKTGEFLFVNETVSQILGYTVEEFRQNGFAFMASLLHPDDAEEVLARNEAAIATANEGRPDYEENQIITFEYRMRHRDGGYRWLYTYGIIFSRDEEGQVENILNISVDISDRKEVEEKLRESRLFVQKVADTIPGLIGVYNIRSGHYVYANNSLQKILGYPAESFTEGGMEFVSSLIHPDDLAEIMEKNSRAVEAVNNNTVPDDVPQYFEYRMRAADGSYRWLHTTGVVFDRNASGEIEHILNISIDISERKEAEEKLRESENFIQGVLGATPNIIYVYDIEEKKNLYVNRELTTILGHEPGIFEEFRHDPLDLIHPDDRELVRGRLDRYPHLKDGELLDNEYRMRHRDGSWRWLNARAHVFRRHEDGRVWQIIGAAKDVTDRRQAQEELRRLNARLEEEIAERTGELSISEAKLREAQKLANLGSWDYDLTNGKISWTDEIYAIHGLDPADGEPDFEDLKKLFADPLQLEQSVADAVEQGIPYGFDAEIILPDGRRKYIHAIGRPVLDETGKCIRLYGATLDVTERKLVEEELLRSREKLSAIFRQAIVGIAQVDTNGRFLMVNDQYCEMTGYSEEDLKSLTMQDITHPDDLGRNMALFKQAIATGEGFTIEKRYRRADGSELWTHNSVAPILNSEGVTEALVAVCHDITSRRRTESDLRQSREQLSLIINAIPASVAYIDAERRYRFMNDAYSRWFAVDREKYIGGDMPALIGTELYAKIGQYSEAALSGKYSEFEIEVPSGGDVIRHISAKYIPHIDESGEVRGYISLDMDISDERRNQENLRVQAQVLNSMNEGVSLADENGIILYTNPAEDRIFGYEPGEMIGMHVSVQNNYPEEMNRRIVEDVIQQLRTRGVWKGEFHNIRKDGTTFITDANITALEMSGKKYWVCVQKDISEEKEVAQALESQHRIIETITNNASLGLFMMDAEGRTTFMNPAAEHITGWTFEELRGKVLHDAVHYIHPDGKSYPIEDCPLGETLTTKRKRSNVEEIFIHKDGHFFPVLCSVSPLIGGDGSVNGVILELRDITEEKKAQQALLESEERLRLISESVPNIIFMADAGGVPQYFNQRWYEYTGMERDVPMEAAWLDAVHPDDVPAAAYRDEFAEKNGAYQRELRFRRASDGAYRWHLVRARAQRDASGRIIRWFGANTDIHDQKVLQEELNLHKNELERLVDERTAELSAANRELLRSNEELEQFAYIASHDLKEPLRMIYSYSQMLQKRYRDQLDREADEFFGYIVEGAGRMNHLLNDLLQFSRIGRSDIRLKNVNTSEIIDIVRHNLKEKMELSFTKLSCTEMPVVRSVPTYMVQLFQNLIENGIKFTGDGPPEIRVAAEDRGLEWLFSVSDNGIGIPEEFRDRIFIIFQRLHTREEYPGTGIGLSICKKIVEFHGGRIWVESGEGMGSTFYFTIAK